MDCPYVTKADKNVGPRMYDLLKKPLQGSPL